MDGERNAVRRYDLPKTAPKIKSCNHANFTFIEDILPTAGEWDNVSISIDASRREPSAPAPGRF